MLLSSAAKNDTYGRLYKGSRQGHQNRVSEGGGGGGLAVIHTTELTLAYYDSEHSNFTLLAGK